MFIVLKDVHASIKAPKKVNTNVNSTIQIKTETTRLDLTMLSVDYDDDTFDYFNNTGKLLESIIFASFKIF